MTALYLFLIALFWVLALDCTDFYATVASDFRSFLTQGKFTEPKYVKPFSCSLCMSWWTGLAFLLVTKAVTVPYIVLTLAIAVFTPVIKDAILLIEDMLLGLIQFLRNKLKLN
mgnify:CR=1 FL=1